jgi:hypothetical protein
MMILKPFDLSGPHDSAAPTTLSARGAIMLRPATGAAEIRRRDHSGGTEAEKWPCY